MDFNVLTVEESEELEREIKYNEVAILLQNLKSTGSGGFAVKFCKCFLLDIGHFIPRSIIHSYAIQKSQIVRS